MPQFYDFDDHLQNGYPNFTIFMPISNAETQIYSLDKALRRGYPHFRHIPGIFFSSCRYLGYLGLEFRLFCNYNCSIFITISWLYYIDGFMLAFFYDFFLWKANNVLDCFLYLSLKGKTKGVKKVNINVC